MSQSLPLKIKIDIRTKPNKQKTLKLKLISHSQQKISKNSKKTSEK